MKNIPFKYAVIISAVLIAVGVAGRLLPHLWNATPIMAVAIFSGFLLGWRYAVIVPAAAMLIGDIFIGFYSLPIMISVYAGFIIAGLIGILIRKHQKFEAFLAGGATGATLFFLITNAAVWFFGTMYPPTFDGLIMSYAMGLPFYKNMLIGDLFYISVFYGTFKSFAFFRGKQRTKASFLQKQEGLHYR